MIMGCSVLTAGQALVPRSIKYRQRSSGRAGDRPQTEGPGLQRRTRRLLPVVCGGRDPVQHHDEEDEPVQVAVHDYGCLGHLYASILSRLFPTAIFG